MKNRTSPFARGALMTKKSLEHRSIRELIEMGTPDSLNEAWLQMQSEAGCGQVERHPIYKDYMSAIQGFKFATSH